MLEFVLVCVWPDGTCGVYTEGKSYKDQSMIGYRMTPADAMLMANNYAALHDVYVRVDDPHHHMKDA